MAGAGYRNWTAGDIPTADQFDTFLQEQTVMRFASASARDTALSVVKASGMVAYLSDVKLFTAYDGSAWQVLAPFFKFASAAARDTALAGVLTEGLFAYLVDTNTLTLYSGAAWATTITPAHGAWTGWTATVTQSGSVTVNQSGTAYQRIGRLVTCRFLVNVTGSGTSANNIVIGGMPFTAAVTGSTVGTAYAGDTSGPIVHTGMLFQESTTTLTILGTASSANPRLGQGFGLAVGDTIGGTFTYEAAADV